MMARLVLLITVSLALAFGEIEEAFRKNTIIPDVVEYAPQQSLKVTYPNNTVADEGNEITPTQSKTEPKVSWEAEPTDFYTLIMTDPDAPSRVDPKFREWHHWLVVNIPSNDVSKGEVLSQYVGAGPPQGTGYHRYVFLVYRQNGKTEFDEKKLTNKSGDNRGGFNTTAFVEKHNLGKPIAGNFFQAVYDDYVPQLHKQLGFKPE